MILFVFYLFLFLFLLNILTLTQKNTPLNIEKFELIIGLFMLNHTNIYKN